MSEKSEQYHNPRDEELTHLRKLEKRPPCHLFPLACCMCPGEDDIPERYLKRISKVFFDDNLKKIIMAGRDALRDMKIEGLA